MSITKVTTRRTKKELLLHLLKLKGIRGQLLRVTTVSDQHHTDAKDVPIFSSDQVSNKLDALVKAVTDFSLEGFTLQKSARK